DKRTLDSQRYTAMDSDKLNQLVANVVQIYQTNNDSKATQMIFSDLSVPFKYRNSPSYNQDGTINTFSAYDEIKRLLVEKGIPDHEIRFIHEATDKNKEAMMREMRTGQIRVLLGSTGKAGTGLNVQDKLIAVHHLDVPWRPSDIT
ncbi:helicase, partial [Bacillus cereus]